MLKSFLVSDQLYCHILLSFVIEAFDGLTETSLAQEFNDFESVSYLILKYNLVVTSLIVVAKVIRMEGGALDLLCFNTKVVDLLVVKDLSFLVVSQVTHEKLECLGWCDWVFQVLDLLL
jgi:hypothetical protein